jgi:hypothetical protein
MAKRVQDHRESMHVLQSRHAFALTTLPNDFANSRESMAPKIHFLVFETDR